MKKPLAIVAGALARRPGIGGHTWALLQYPLGFKALGWDVLFVDQLEPAAAVDRDHRPAPLEASSSVRYFLDVMERFGLREQCALLTPDGGSIGVSRRDVIARARDSAFVLNIMGYLRDPDVLGAAPRRVFLDIDPGFGQMWKALGLSDIFAGHDAFVTIGENIGQPHCGIPTCGLQWITTPQPVALEYWPVTPAAGGRFTSVASWRGGYGPVDYNGRTYGLRVHEFRKFFDLPERTGCTFELALDIHRNDEKDLDALRRYGWHLVDPRAVAGTPDDYQRYIQQSAAELMIAKQMYVDTNSAWLSDRSLCYLASGRPVLAQDTGISQRYPTGAGLVTFTSVEEAATAATAIRNELPRHSRAARGLAEDLFDARKVLGRLADAVTAT